MSQDHINQVLLETVQNTLLCLYFEIQRSSRYVPVKTRNKILVKAIKPKIQQVRYKIIKGHLRTLLKYGRDQDCDLESKLNGLLEVINNTDNKNRKTI